MADDQVGFAFDRFAGAFRRDGQAGHQARHRSGAVAQEQTNVVPVRGQARRGELFEVVDHGGKCEHGIIPCEFSR